MSRPSRSRRSRIGDVLALATGSLLVAPSLDLREETGFLDRTIRHEGRTHRYQVYVPPGYSRHHRWPVVLFLHGSGERGIDGRLPTTVGLGEALRRYPERFPAIVVFPQAPEGVRWPGAAARLALATLAKTQKEFHTDHQRVSLVGLSMGGNGAWYLAYRHPERFAALVAICGWFVPRPSLPTAEPVVPGSVAAADSALAERVSGLPTWIFHGDSDPIVPVDDARRIATRLWSMSAPARYTEFTGIGHDSWTPALERADLAEWLLAQRRSRGRGH